NLLHLRRRYAAGRRFEDVTHREAVDYDQDRPLRPRQDRPVAPHVPADRLRAALAAARRFLLGIVEVSPGTVIGERAALELAEADVVQLREHEARNAATLEREVGGFLGAPELAHDAKVDRRVRQELAEPPSLLAPELGERSGDLRIAVRQALDREHALGVP